MSKIKLICSGARTVGRDMYLRRNMYILVNLREESKIWSGCVSFKEDRHMPEECKCVNERNVKSTLRIKGVWVSVIRVNAHTEDSKKKVKESFHEQLQAT